MVRAGVDDVRGRGTQEGCREDKLSITHAHARRNLSSVWTDISSKQANSISVQARGGWFGDDLISLGSAIRADPAL